MEPLELARVEEANFFEDLERLGCREPTLVLRVSEHIEDIVQFTSEVVEQGYGYTTTDGSVWFDVAKLGGAYGAFAEGRGTSTAAAQAAALIEEDPASASDNKRDQRDFALWKAVWKSKFYGAFDLHAINATPARWRGDAGSSALDSASTDTSSPRNDLVKNCRAPDALVDFHTGGRPRKKGKSRGPLLGVLVDLDGTLNVVR